MNSEIYTLKEDGFCDASGVLEDTELNHLADLVLRSDSDKESNRNKRLWQSHPEIRRIATKPSMLDLVGAFFEDSGFYLWGAQILHREPDSIHPWHTDIETHMGGFVSILIAIDGADDSQFFAIRGSHRSGAPVQKYFRWGDEARADMSGSAMLMRLGELGLNGQVAQLQCLPGQGILFDGRLWHATQTGGVRPRKSLLLQYGRSDAAIYTYSSVDYPFKFDPRRRPPVLHLSGEPDVVKNSTWLLGTDNRIGAPIASTHASTKLSCEPGQAWSRFPFFKTETPVLERLQCHASVLQPGRMPHLPHAHEDEEILIIVSGSAAILTSAGEGDQWQAQPARNGDLFYYPAGFRHTIMNAGLEEAGAPLAYLMFRWRARSRGLAQVSPFKLSRKAVLGPERMEVEYPSSRLGKLHFHTTRLQPGQGFHHRHIDRYCTAILVMEGELTVIDQTLGPGGVFLTRAGELHNTVNQGDSPNSYLVIEFHAREELPPGFSA